METGETKMVKNLKMLRKAFGYTQRELADKINVSPKTIQKYETSENEPSIKSLMSLADVFNVSLDFLVGHQVTGKDPIFPIDENEFFFIEQFRSFDESTQDCIKKLFDKISEP